MLLETPCSPGLCWTVVSVTLRNDHTVTPGQHGFVRLLLVFCCFVVAIVDVVVAVARVLRHRQRVTWNGPWRVLCNHSHLAIHRFNIQTHPINDQHTTTTMPSGSTHRLHVRARHVSYQRSKRRSNPDVSLLKIEGVDSTEAAK